jgi:hypothetical protein
MPYPNFHSARLRNPTDFNPDTFRNTEGGTIFGHIKVPKTVQIIWGKLKGKDKEEDPPIPQALRFKIEDWEVEEAKKWLEDNNIEYILFEPAKKEEKEIEENIFIAKQLIIKQLENKNKNTFKFVATKQIVDMDGDMVFINENEKGKGLLLDYFNQHKVFLMHHNNEALPVGKVLSYQKMTDKNAIPFLEIEVEFADTERGREIKYLYENDFMKMVSIRFKSEIAEKNIYGGHNYYQVKLIEISAVPLGANQEAVILKGLKQIENEKQFTEKKEIDEKIEKIQKKLFCLSSKDKERDNHSRIIDSILNMLEKKEEVDND